MENTELIKEAVENTAEAIAPVVTKSSGIGKKIGLGIGTFVMGVISGITFQKISDHKKKKLITIDRQEQDLWYGDETEDEDFVLPDDIPEEQEEQ